MKSIEISITTSTAGAATAYSGTAVIGKGWVEAVDYYPGTIATGATVTLTDEFNGGSFTIWSKASAGTANIRVYPRQLQTLNTDGTALSTHAKMIAAGRFKVVVSSGGASAIGKIIVHIEENA